MPTGKRRNTDSQGNVYVVGSTRSPNFPVIAAVQNHLAAAGSYDVFVAKFDPSGNPVYAECRIVSAHLTQ